MGSCQPGLRWDAQQSMKPLYLFSQFPTALAAGSFRVEDVLWPIGVC